MRTGLFNPIQTWEVVTASVNLPSPARDASTTTPIQPTDACTATTIFMKPSNSLRWHEMQPVTAAHKHTLEYIVGISSVI